MSQMLPEDMMALLGGGGGDPAAAQGGIPPDMMAMLGGGAPEGAVAPSIVEGEPGGGEDPLVGAIDLIQEAIDAESDQEDIQVMLQCQTKLQNILAKNQADQDAALGGQVSPKAVRKMAPGGGGF
ncbi:MAG: hypothetical protein L0191_09220, partial [Acidobacteria bacterium]|nr:hypothetical protein [Acidobacteriota bacterium]